MQKGVGISESLPVRQHLDTGSFTVCYAQDQRCLSIKEISVCGDRDVIDTPFGSVADVLSQ